MKLSLILFITFISFGLIAQPNWNPPPGSDSDATVIIPDYVLSNEIGYQFSIGDIIGAFYLDDNEDLQCGGLKMVEDLSSGTAMAVFGDDSNTPAKDGFSNGDVIIWQIWNAAANVIIEGADAVYANFSTTTYSNNAIIIIQELLDAELEYFTTRLIDDEAVSIEWVTLSETNVNYFQIERSTNGSSFRPIGNPIQGEVFSVDRLTYAFVDKAPENGLNYYRLKIVDLDETFAYSEISSINFESKSGLKIINTLASDRLILKLSEYGENQDIILINNKGEQIRRLSFSHQEQIVELPLSDLHNGIYYLKARNQKAMRFLVSK